MASQMAMRNMSPCEGVKPARGPDEACLRSPGGLNPAFELATIAGEPARMKGVRACHPKAGPTPREDQGVGGRGRKDWSWRRSVEGRAAPWSRNGHGAACRVRVKVIINDHQ